MATTEVRVSSTVLGRVVLAAEGRRPSLFGSARAPYDPRMTDCAQLYRDNVAG